MKYQLPQNLSVLQTAIQQSPNTIVITNLDGNIEYANPAFEKITGYTVEEAIGLNPRVLKSGKQSPDYYKKLWDTIMSGKVWTGDFHNRRKDGSFYWERATISPVFNEQNKMTHFIAIKIDITQQKEAEEKLYYSEKLLRSSFASANIGICLIDAETRFMKINQEMVNLLGYSEEEFFSQKMMDFVHADFKIQYGNYIQTALQKEAEQGNFEMVFLHKEGGLIWAQVSIAAIRDRLGNISNFIVHLKNITNEKKNASILSDYYNRFITVLDSVDAIIYVADLETYQILFINEYTRKIFGDVEGKICWQVLQKNQNQVCEFCPNKYLLSGEGMVEGYWQELLNTLTGRWYQVHDKIITWIDGRSVRLEVANDITELKQAQAVVEQANQVKSDFVANMSHEMRTPLNAVIGFTELLSNSPLNNEQTQYIENVLYAARSLLDVINDVLDLSKIEANQLELDEEITDIVHLAEQVYQIINVSAKKKQLELFFHFEPDMPRFITIDQIRIRQVLLNLLSNAVKFTNQGTVTLSISFVSDLSSDLPTVLPQVLSLSTQKKENQRKIGFFTFSVQDTGIGITSEQQKKLFQPFGQADTSITRRFGGTGLGLVISNRLLAKMNSKLELESEYGKGSRFFFTLKRVYNFENPLKEEKNQLAKNLGSVSQSSRTIEPILCKKEKPVILIAEDIPVNRMLIKEILRRFLPDAMIYEVDNGRAVVEFLQKLRPDLIFMDIQMPEMDGYEAARMIRQNKSTFNIPIVALTAGIMEQEREKSVQSGMNEYLTKPIDTILLRDMLIKYLN